MESTRRRALKTDDIESELTYWVDRFRYEW